MFVLGVDWEERFGLRSLPAEKQDDWDELLNCGSLLGQYFMMDIQTKPSDDGYAGEPTSIHECWVLGNEAGSADYLVDSGKHPS